MRLIKFAIAVLLCTVPLGAQTSAGRIGGGVFDSTGAVIPNAKVVAHNTETGVDYATSSNGEGAWVVYPLPPGVYNLTAESSGFRAREFQKITVEVAQVMTLDFHLEVAATKQETVEVTETATAIVTDSPSVESTIARGQVETLPLNGLDFNSLVTIAPGAVESAYTGGDFGGVALNGNRTYGNGYTIDGSPNNNPFQNKAAAPVSVDVIREFKVTSGAAPAEYGQAGSQVTLVTRSGSNAYHGSAFEYHRDTTWQASSPFNPGVERPFDRNQFGGSLGGPIRRNQTFYFLNYEGNRQNQSDAIVATMPTAPFWTGDFSALLARNIQLKDPLAAKATFPGNILPVSRLNPVAIKLHPYFGLPTSPGYANNYVRNSSAPTEGNQFTTRLDQTLPRSQNLSFRFTQANSDAFSSSITANQSGYTVVNRTNNASLGWTMPVNATTIAEAHLGFSDFHSKQIYAPNGLPTATDVGMVGFTSNNPLIQQMPQIIFAGNDAFTRLNYGPANASTTLNQANKNESMAGAVTMIRGNHTIKTGLELRNLTSPSLLQTTGSGTMNFNGSNGAASSGYSFADFMLGLPTNALQAPPVGLITLKQHQFAGYVQDDWRIFSRLTLNVGLRYELSPSPYEVNNRFSMFDPATGAIVVASDNGVLPTSQYSPTVVAKLTDSKGNWVFPLISDKQAGFPARSLLQTQYKNFGPRFGFSYNLGGKRHTVLRGGYGIFYNSYPMQNLQQITGINPPFAGNFSYAQAITNGVPAITLDNPYGGKSTASVSPGGFVENWQAPSNQQWNVSMEGELGRGTTLTVSSIGNKGTHLFRAYNANQIHLDPVTGQSVYTYQNTYGTAAISERTTDGNSIYNAMQTVVRRRLSRNLIFEFNWTWAKGIDNVTSALNVSALDVENLGRDRADSDYVRRQTIHANFTWELPVGRGHAFLSAPPRWLDAIAGGWRLSGIWSDYSGMRFTPTMNSTGLANTRPSVVYGVQANLPSDQRSTAGWFNPAAFTAPLSNCGPFQNAPCFGNAGRNILIGPGINMVDASLSKSIPIFGEKQRLTFRLEFFNALNHPNWDLPNANISAPNIVSTITGVVKDMREAQFAVRFDF